MKIIRATEKNIPDIARLFDLYRQFYHCDPDISRATEFIGERVRNGESTIFAADNAGILVGFTQIYPSFCSVEAIKIYILYDLYVDAAVRNSGIGKQLMNRAAEYAKKHGAKRIDLMTAFDNKPGQHLYEKLGYEKVDEDFFNYSLNV